MKKKGYKCIVKSTTDPLDSYYKAGTMEYMIDGEAGELYLNSDLYLIYRLDNERLDIIAVLDNPCDCSCREEHFVLQLNESKSILGGHRGHFVFYSITFTDIQ